MLRSPFRYALSASIFVSSLATLQLSAQQHKTSVASLSGQGIDQVISSKSADLQSSMQSGSSAISVAVGNMLSSGRRDLITGYAVGQHGAITVQPGLQGSASSGSPFGKQAIAVSLPVQPDLLAAASFLGHGHDDIAVAAKGSKTVYLLANDGKGNLGTPRPLALGGGVDTLGSWQSADSRTFVVAAECNSNGACGLEFIATDGSAKTFIALGSPAVSVETVSVNGGKTQDIVALTSAGVSVVDGDTILSSSPSVTNIAVTNAIASAAGLFAYDRRGFQQIAVLGSDATLRIFARSGVDTSVASQQAIQTGRNAARHGGSRTTAPSPRGIAWVQAESVSSVGAPSNSAVMSSGRFTGSGFDDLIVQEGSQGIKVSNPLTIHGGVGQTTPVVSSYQSSATNHLTAMAKVQAGAQPGLVAADGQAHPLYTVPTTNNTYFVNTTVDSLDDLSTSGRCSGSEVPCSLRDAIGLANQAYAGGYNGVDVISIPAGTYTLSGNNGSTYDVNGSLNTHFDVDAPISFVGSGLGTTIINANGVDKVFTVNSGVVNPYSPIDVYFSNLTIENGTNNNDPTCAACDYFGGLIDFESYGPGQLGFSNVSLSAGTALNSPGGALFATNSNTSSPSGLIEFDSTSIVGNSSPEQGGGLWVGEFLPVVLSGDTITGNTTGPSVNTTDPSGDGLGGGVYLQGGVNASVAITSTTFASNVASDSGGGLFATYIGPAVSSSTFTENSAGGFGAGLYLDNENFPASVIATQITANMLSGSSGQQYSGPYTSNGAGMCVEGTVSTSTAPVAIHYSRFVGNTGGHTNGLGIGCMSSNAYAVVSATDNWWGCNAAATGNGCDIAASAFTSTAPLTVTPYTILTASVSSRTPALGTTVTAFGSLGQDSAGAVYSQANDFALDGITSSIAITLHNGAQTASGPIALNTTAAPALSYAASALSASATVLGSGTATVQVDNASAVATFVVQDAPTQIVFSSVPAATLVAGGNAGTIQATLQDSTGSVVTSDSSTVVSLVVTGPSGYSQLYTAQASGGVVTFSLTGVPLTAAGTYTYTAEASGLSSASASETVTASAFAKLSVTGLGTIAAPGVSGTALVSASDAYGNIVTSFTGTIALSSSDTTATYSPASYTFSSADQGAHAFSVIFNTAGSQSLTATSGSISGSEPGITVEDAIWVLNQTDQAVRLTSAGNQTTVAGPNNGLSPYSGIAFDNAGNVWVTELDNNTFAKYSPRGTLLTSPGSVGGLYQPTSLSIDGLGQAWFANSGNKSLTVVSNSGAAISPSTGIQPGNLTTPTGVAIDSSGSVWVTTGGSAPVVKVIGVAAPVVTPIASATSANTLGAQP